MEKAAIRAVESRGDSKSAPYRTSGEANKLDLNQKELERGSSPILRTAYRPSNAAAVRVGSLGQG
jgi:hypothetical protein